MDTILHYLFKGIMVKFRYMEPLPVLLGTINYKEAVRLGLLKPLTVYVKTRGKKKEIFYRLTVPYWLCYTVEVVGTPYKYERDSEKIARMWGKSFMLEPGEHIINTWFYVCDDTAEYSVRDFIDVAVSNGMSTSKKRIEIEVVDVDKLKQTRARRIHGFIPFYRRG